MAKDTPERRPKIYVTSRGARYVKADEVLASPEVQAKIKKMAEILVEPKSSDTSQKDRK